MATAGRRTENSIASRLLSAGHDFEFFQAVRLLMRVTPDKAPIGGGAKPGEEVVRFGSRVTLEFPASAIHEIAPHPRGGPPAMTVAFMGLMGPNGVMPIHYTEWMVLRESAKDRAMAAFFNIFNHRWISLFYRAWEKHNLPVAYERSQLERRPAVRVNHFLFDLIGLGTPGLQRRMLVRDDSLLFYAGLIAQRPRSASALGGILRDYFAIPVEIVQCLGGWYTLESGDRAYLEGDGVYNCLGDGAVAGDAVWDQQSRFRLRLGPLRYTRFCDFLPGTRALARMTDLVRFVAGTALDFETQLVLRGAEVPAAQLSDSAPRLGWDSWLTEVALAEDRSDAVFHGTTTGGVSEWL